MSKPGQGNLNQQHRLEINSFNGVGVCASECWETGRALGATAGPLSLVLMVPVPFTAPPAEGPSGVAALGCGSLLCSHLCGPGQPSLAQVTLPLEARREERGSAL